MTSYKLTYFNGRGRAEVIRLIFAQAGVDFDDDRIDKKDWPLLKESAPFGQLPYLTIEEIDGTIVQLAQSLTIARYIAHKYDLAGSNLLEHAKCDMIVDCVEDTVKPILSAFFEKDEVKKEAILKRYQDEQLPIFMSNFEKFLLANGGEDGYFVGENVTWADISVMALKDYFKAINFDFNFVTYPVISGLMDRVANQPKIEEWLRNRPDTEF